MMRLSLLSTVVAFAIGVGSHGSASAAQLPPPSSGACDMAVRSHERLRAVLALMDKLPSSDADLWNGYRPGDVPYIFLISGAAQQPCAAIWRKGVPPSAFAPAAAPRLDTPLYGFFLPETAKGRRQPDELRAQLRGLGVEQAVVIALEGDAKLGFALGSDNHFDLAVHEAFHVHVQAPTWYEFPATHRWPAWARHGNRQQLAAACYGSANPQEQKMSAERDPLVTAAMGALTGAPIAQVCRSASLFVEERRRRWTQLSAARIAADDGGAAMSCAVAESNMEMNEGVGDFVAWMTAHGLGVVDDARVRQRFMAMSRDMFYGLGSMQLVVLRRLLGAEFPAATAAIASSTTGESGAIFNVLESELVRRCR